ncbi:MAG: DUF4932 domain-containing protein, partial [candidate division Zixibacteria bacterium]|nr:DUF4932 domain-containing protein [candidate division Zixibacteria bacterium]
MKVSKILLFSLALSLLLVITGRSEKAQNQTQTTDTLVITVDSRIELLGVVQFLSDYGERYGLITQYDFPYKNDVREHFQQYANHPAVKLFAKMSAQGFSFD